MPSTPFQPDVHGFHFSNSFDNHRWIGPVHINPRGRCGGMSYAALDFFLTETAIPDDTTPPPEGSGLSTYLSHRQDKSLSNTLDKWIELSVNPFGWRTSEFWHWGIQDHSGGRLEELKSQIDQGRPAVLGLFNAHNHIRHHQVLAIGYEGGPGDLAIRVYDPNYPHATKTLRPYPHPTDPRYGYDDDPTETPQKQWLTYFVDLRYGVVKPFTEDNSVSLDISGEDWQGRREENASFTFTAAIGTNFRGAALVRCDFGESNMDNANFYGAKLVHSNFSDSSLNYCDFHGADVKVASLHRSRIRGGNFKGTDLVEAELTGAYLEDCNFYGANLHKTDLNGVDASSANFHGANLSHANLAGSDFREANFYGADLTHSNLSGSDFTGANMARADLRGAAREHTRGL